MDAAPPCVVDGRAVRVFDARHAEVAVVRQVAFFHTRQYEPAEDAGDAPQHVVGCGTLDTEDGVAVTFKLFYTQQELAEAEHIFCSDEYARVPNAPQLVATGFVSTEQLRRRGATFAGVEPAPRRMLCLVMTTVDGDTVGTVVRAATAGSSLALLRLATEPVAAIDWDQHVYAKGWYARAADPSHATPGYEIFTYDTCPPDIKPSDVMLWRFLVTLCKGEEASTTPTLFGADPRVAAFVARVLGADDGGGGGVMALEAFFPLGRTRPLADHAVWAAELAAIGDGGDPVARAFAGVVGGAARIALACDTVALYHGDFRSKNLVIGHLRLRRP